ncbi:hypothetical protein [Streptomyces sporangiiformans]|uniref:Uncharacterized protein n=1 Tax=Streptomyces sporangiiformans TaxID=2315329 RepID=A0A505D2B6_9ACTN|nr:hypothetical protein [Streptomyces sporangiiformans]TPQ16967.1 hypothetical protein FGD71_038815 [Streptomyces sporangiiformans]
MGERHGDGGSFDRRAGRPVNGWSKSDAATAAGRQDVPALESFLAAAMCADALDPDAENQAMAAFRAARAAGTHEAQTRRRDDWRPRAERWGGRSLRATLAGLLASVALGGVAIAAIGTAGTSGDGDDGPRPSSTAPDQSANDSGGTGAPGSTAPGSSAPGRRDGDTGGPSVRPSSAQDLEAHCRAYDAVGKNGEALDSIAWKRLVEAAGGEKKVEKYCADRTGQPATGQPTTGEPATGQPTESPGGADSRPENEAPAPTVEPDPPKPSKVPGKGDLKDAAP